MKIGPIAFSLASALAVPALVSAQDGGIDLADTLRAVEMSAVERRPSFADRAEVARIVERRYPGGLRQARVGGTAVVRLVVDDEGRALAPRIAEPSGNEALDAAAMEAVRDIRFVPARRGGAPHPVWVEMPVAFVPPGPDAIDGVALETVRAWADSAGALAPSQVEEAPELRDPAAAVRALKEAYPPHLKEARVGGTSLVWMVIGERGEVSGARVAASAGNGELDRAALGAARGLRFRAARVGGRPVASWIALPVEFEAPRPPRVARPDSLGSYEMADVEELPVLQNRTEVAREIGRVYPPLLRDQGVTGQVTIRFRVDTLGVPGPIEVESASHGEFAAAARMVGARMRFAPARLNRKKVGVWVTIPVSFQLRGPVDLDLPGRSGNPPPLPGTMPQPNPRPGRPADRWGNPYPE